MLSLICLFACIAAVLAIYNYFAHAADVRELRESLTIINNDMQRLTHIVQDQKFPVVHRTVHIKEMHEIQPTPSRDEMLAEEDARALSFIDKAVDAEKE